MSRSDDYKDGLRDGADALSDDFLSATREVAEHVGREIAGAIRSNASGGQTVRSTAYYYGGSESRDVTKALYGANADGAVRRAADYINVNGGSWSSPESAAIVAGWFANAIKGQMPRHEGHHEAQRTLGAFNSIHKAALGGQTDSIGGYAVPNIVGNEVLKIIRDASQIYGRARQQVMTSDTLSFPDEATAVTVNWVAEGGTLTGGEPVFGVKTLNAKKLVGRATFSLELLDDSNVAILPFLQSCFAEKMGGELDFQSMEGTGSPFTGVSGATSVNDCARTNGTNGVSISYANTGTWGSLVQIFTAARESYTRDQGVWVCSPGVYASIIGLTDTNGQPIVRLGGVEGAPGNSIFGRPVIVSNRLGNTTVGAGTNSVGSLYFGPPSALVFGNRTNFRFDVSDAVSWNTYQADCRLVGRFGYVVGVPAAWSKQGAVRTS